VSAYYNEWEAYPAQWLRNLISAGLIPPGDVDERSIVDVRPDDLRGYTQAHFFAGVGGWPYALRLAGFGDDREVWTGSCPCQPFSEAGHGIGKQDSRHLWPEFFRLIAAVRPSILFGEQVPQAIHYGWLDEVADDLEGCGYAIGACVLSACAVEARQERERLWFVACSDRYTPQRPSVTRLERHSWADEPGVDRLAYGLPTRAQRLRAYGNAIVPQLAAEFVKAVMECQP
jgi:DNA (cytosine-5)-methyltransferase 1